VQVLISIAKSVVLNSSGIGDGDIIVIIVVNVFASIV
jgi:hypothetical protein